MKVMGSFLLRATLALLLNASASADEVAMGKMLFRQCAVCHSVEPEVKKIGPSLHGVVNRPIASVAGFSYSTDMAALKKTWDKETLDLFMTDPRMMFPGTFMATAGIKKAQDRQALLAYLATLR